MGKKTSNKFIPLAAFEDAESQPETQTGTAASVPKGSFYKKPDIATAGSNVNLGVGLTGPVKRNQLGTSNIPHFICPRIQTNILQTSATRPQTCHFR